MEPDETPTHAFIVRLWLEQPADEAGRPAWRGRVTYVADNSSRVFEDLDDLCDFIRERLRAPDI